MNALFKAQDGLLVALVGAIFLYASRDLDMGVPRNMGPGMFPVVLSALTIVFGLLIAVVNVVRDVTLPRQFPWLGLCGVVASIALYALLIERLGIALTTLCAISVLALVIPRMKWLETVLLSIGVSAFLWLTFVLGLGMPLRLFPGF